MLEAGLTPIDCQSIPDFRKNPNVSSNSGCYIATCVYGSYDCPQVWTLRRFRDDTLDATWYGRLFIRCYYAISPTLVKWFGNTTWFKKSLAWSFRFARYKTQARWRIGHLHIMIGTNLFSTTAGFSS